MIECFKINAYKADTTHDHTVGSYALKHLLQTPAVKHGAMGWGFF